MFLPKNERTNSILLLVDLFSFVFWKKVKTPKRHFETNWPLLHGKRSEKFKYLYKKMPRSFWTQSKLKKFITKTQMCENKNATSKWILTHCVYNIHGQDSCDDEK
mgnify:CR=1 FL=1